MVRFLTWVLLVTFLVTTASDTSAQISLLNDQSGEAEAAISTEDLTPETVDALVSRLTDAEVRELLIDQLGNGAQSGDGANEGSDFGTFFFHATSGAFGTIGDTIARVPLMFEGVSGALATFNQKADGRVWSQLLWALVFGVAIGFLIEAAVRWLVLRWLPPPVIVQDPTLRQSMSFLARRLLHEVLGVIVFSIVASKAAGQVLPEDLVGFGQTILTYMIVIPRLTYSIARFLASPRYPAYRIVHADDATARFATRHMVGLALFYGLTVTTLEFTFINGVEVGALRAGFWMDLILRLYLIWIIWTAWDGLVSMMRGGEETITPLEDRVARAYPAFSIAAVVVMWWVLNVIISYQAFDVLRTRGDLVTLILLMFAPAFDTLIRGMVHHFVPPMSGEGPIAEKAYAATKAAYKRIGRVIMISIGLVVIAVSWGISPERLASAGAAGQIIKAFFDISFILALGYLVWEVVTLLINRKLANEMTAQGLTAEAASAGEIGGAGGTRLSTVLPLLLVVLQVAIVIVFGLIALSELGVDTTPLLAGAGIAGLAIGFGAQKLVTDVVSGAFFLIDDAFRMGEYVEMGDTKGTVEKISVRSMQLRHHRGPVFTVPYGEIQFLKNYSRDWGIMKLPFIFPFDADPEKIRKIFKKIGQELMEHPEFGDYFLEPFKSQGVVSIDDIGMTIRGKFMAKPGKQFEIRKAVFTRVHHALEEAGIPFARREVRVAIPDGAKAEDLTEDQKRELAGAASTTTQT